MNDWKKVNQNGEIKKFEKVGDEVSGLYVETHEIPNKLGAAGQVTHVYTIEQKDGKQVAIFGKASLDLSMAKIKTGQEVRIVYLGKQKNPKTGFSFHAFDVYSREVNADQASIPEEEVDNDEIPF